MSKIALRPFKEKLSKRREMFSKPPKRKLVKHITPQLLFKAICALFLSFTKLIGGTSPLGFAFFAAIIGGTDAYICALISAVGLFISGGSVVSVGKFVISVILFSLIYERFLPEKHKKIKTLSLISSLCLFFSGIFLLFATMTIGGYPLIYDFLILFTEALTVYFASVAFKIAVPIIFSLNIRRSLRTEESISLAFLTGSIICGLGDIGFEGIFSLSGTLCVLAVLAFATRFGSLHGCVSGIVMGLVYCVSRGRIDACAASFAASGLCAGYFSKHGRWASCISFVMTNAVITILSNGSSEVLINLFDTALASCILYCMPERLYNAINNMGTISHPAAELASNRLSFAANTLTECEKSFQEIFKIKDISNYNKILLYRRTAYKACSGCGLRKYCWGRDVASTKEALDNLTEIISSGESPKKESAPPHCLRGEQFVSEFKKMYEIYKNDCVWASKVGEVQSSVYQSFNAMSSLINQTAKKVLSANDCDTIASDDIFYRLKKEGIFAKEVFVNGDGDNTKIHITLSECGGFGRCEGAVEKVLKNATGKSFVRTGLRHCGKCSFTYVVKPSFSISTAVSGAIKHSKKTSGDHAVYALVDRDTYAIILCDGMGSGETARSESKLCANLLMTLLESGLDVQSAVSIINSMLISSFSDTLAAIDLCLINLNDGTTKVYKCGGADTYAKTDNKVETITAETLPVGATENKCEFFTLPSKKGSMIVLCSDGIVSANRKNSVWIKKIIESYEGTEPETLAKQILEEAKKANAKLKDDATVVASYIG